MGGKLALRPIADWKVKNDRDGIRCWLMGICSEAQNGGKTGCSALRRIHRVVGQGSLFCRGLNLVP